MNPKNKASDAFSYQIILRNELKFKKVHRVVDWAIETYPDKEYSFELFAYEEDYTHRRKFKD